ncbi:MAG TPA: apolipoprotein N-acyltransferase [Pyrinomonadaceae bacterium]|nr:apolipoprotein N-acyltransferase [Pyrinomonadaceae bacterium]
MASALLLIFAFPNFEFYYLAWIALVPLLVVIARQPAPFRIFFLGWAVGTVFFYGTCYWLTYSMINYGGLPRLLSYALVVPAAIVVGIFPGFFAALLALVVRRWGHMALLLAPVFWTALEWTRLGVTGQLWNALGYSQAYQPLLIQNAKWGGVYAVSFLIVAINSALALIVIKRTRWTIPAAAAVVLLVAFLIVFPPWMMIDYNPWIRVVAVQPNVPMTPYKSPAETQQLLERHLSLSTQGLSQIPDDATQRIVIWPESPMNFSWASSKAFQEFITDFTRENRTSLIFNSLEPARADGSYNSAVLINEEGRLISQYDKIRLMPFGEYVPLPQWLPGASLITGIVGDFTAGEQYTLMPFGDRKAGLFICIESAYPWIARNLTREGANILINISNDGYLGPTAVMRQHLANVIFRAVENDRQMLRVTNTGLTALISERGEIEDLTSAFQPDVRVWPVHSRTGSTFYTRHGDVFVQACTFISLLVLAAVTFFEARRRRAQRKTWRVSPRTRE